MAGDVQVKISDRTDEAIVEMTGIVSQELLLEFSELMIFYVKLFSPYETGHNRDSIRMDPIAPDTKTTVVRIVTESGYGGWLEVGTARRPATPYFAPAWKQAKEDLVSIKDTGVL